MKKKKTNKEDKSLQKKEKELYEIYNEEYKIITNVDKKYLISKILINTFFILSIIIIAIISTDYIRVAKYNKKPLFVIKKKEYKDGGTKEYIGIGYKVIDYNQLQGRRDIEIGTWKLKYNTNPITLEDIDLAIEITDNEENTYKKYYKKFVRIISTLKSIDKKNNNLILEYTDEDGKYSLDIYCRLVDDYKNIDNIEKEKSITIIGTVDKYKTKTKKSNKRIYINNCFAEQ